MDTTRSARAITLQAGVKPVAQDVFAVTSGTDSTKSYIVTLPSGSCNCPDFLFRQVECKHIIAARLFNWRSSA